MEGAHLHFGVVNFFTIGLMLAGWALIIKGVNTARNKSAS